MRYFEIVKNDYRVYKNKNIVMPARSTKNSAGYDFYLPEKIIIPPKQTVFVWTDIKVKMPSDEVLLLFMRSSIGIKKHCMLANTVGVIDSDYYGNPDNDGNIGIAIYNYGNDEVIFNENEKIMQGIFIKFLKIPNDFILMNRNGGFGSTNI